MNKIKIISLSILFISINFVSGQSNSANFKPWSASVYGGLFFGSASPENYNRSGNAGIDISYNYTSYIAIYINGTYNFLGQTNELDYHSTTGLLESTMGVKFYADTAFFKLFTEVGFGYYQRIQHVSYQQSSYSDNNDGLGINFGLGADFKLDNNVNFIIKGKLHFSNATLNGNSLSYGGIYSGIKYNF